IVLACLNQPTLVASGRTRDRSSLEDLQRAVELLRGVGDEHGEAIALRTLGNALRRYGFMAWSLEIFALALARYEASGDPVGRWQSLRYIGQTHLDLGKHEEARRFLAAAQVVAMELGDPRLLAQTRYWIGHCCLAVGDLAGAQAAFDSVFEIYRDDAGIGHAYAVHGLAWLACVRGAYSEAEQQHGVAADLLARLGADAALEGRVWLSLAALRQAQRQMDEWILALERAVAMFSGCGATYLEVQALARLGEALMDRGDPAGAQDAWARVDELYAAAQVPEADRIYGRPGR